MFDTTSQCWTDCLGVYRQVLAEAGAMHSSDYEEGLSLKIVFTETEKILNSVDGWTKP